MPKICEMFHEVCMTDNSDPWKSKAYLFACLSSKGLLVLRGFPILVLYLDLFSLRMWSKKFIGKLPDGRTLCETKRENDGTRLTTTNHENLRNILKSYQYTDIENDDINKTPRPSLSQTVATFVKARVISYDTWLHAITQIFVCLRKFRRNKAEETFIKYMPIQGKKREKYI